MDQPSACSIQRHFLQFDDPRNTRKTSALRYKSTSARRSRGRSTDGPVCIGNFSVRRAAAACSIKTRRQRLESGRLEFQYFAAGAMHLKRFSLPSQFPENFAVSLSALSTLCASQLEKNTRLLTSQETRAIYLNNRKSTATLKLSGSRNNSRFTEQISLTHIEFCKHRSSATLQISDSYNKILIQF